MHCLSVVVVVVMVVAVVVAVVYIDRGRADLSEIGISILGTG